MLKYIYRLTNMDVMDTLLIFHAVSILMTACIVLFMCYIWKSKKVTYRLWLVFLGMLVIFFALNYSSLLQIRSLESVSLDTLDWNVAFSKLCRCNCFITLATGPMYFMLYCMRGIQRSIKKAQKAARRRNQTEEYY